ncbi:MAG: nucleotidyl transferase AbiEii/AbiGii toxin family protein [Bdellovibrionota bacterium]
MSLKAAIKKIHRLLENAKIDHALIGGLALAVHGINRATGDIDLLVDEANRSKLIEELKNSKYALRMETPEVLHFQGPVRLDILLARRPVSRGMLARAKITPLLNIKCLDPEDLIGLKIQAYQNNPRRALQDKADIQFLLEKYDQLLDMERVKSYAEVFNQWPEIQKLGRKP